MQEKAEFIPEQPIEENKNVDTKKTHKWWYVALLVSLVCLYTIMVAFNVVGSLSGGSNLLFKNSVGNVSDLFYVEVTPAGWVFSIIWTVIFIWQYLWLIYALTTLFRKNKDGERIYVAHDFIHWGILVAFAFNNIFVIIWLFLWDSYKLGGACAVIALTAIALHVCLVLSLRKGYYYKQQMLDSGLRKDVWLNRFLLQNGLAFFLTWLSLATNLNFASFLAYEASVNVTDASTVALIIILALVIAYFVIENFVWPKFFVYIYSPWFVLNLALIGSMTKNYNKTSPTRNNIITAVLLALIVLFTVVKIIMNILFHTKLRERVHGTCLLRRNGVKNLNEEKIEKLESQMK